MDQAPITRYISPQEVVRLRAGHRRESVRSAGGLNSLRCLMYANVVHFFFASYFASYYIIQFSTKIVEGFTGLKKQ